MKRKIAQLFILLLSVLTVSACASMDDEQSTADEHSVSTTERSGFNAPAENTSQNVSDTDENISVKYTVGDIILNSGSVIKTSGLTELDGSDLPAAVVVGIKDNGAFFAVGVHRSDEPLQWESDETENSPAFDFISGYAEKHGLTGETASGWYMPNITELRTLYENRSAVNEALEKIYQLDNNAAMNGLSTTWYWSSSQSESQEDYAWFIHFYNGYAGECPKNFTNVNVVAVREL